MSDIKIQPSATGSATVTLTAPATGTARTVTLPDGTGSLIADNGSGSVGIGTSSPDGTVHIHTASAGSVTANADADDLVVENSGHTGINILSPDASRSAIQLGHTSDNLEMQIRHDGATSLTQIISDDPITFNVTDGSESARVTADGITFQGDTAAANALDDYEEGTFTPLLKFSGATTGIVQNSSYTTGWYTKVGNLVNFGFILILSNKGSASGSAQITGLPFALNDVTYQQTTLSLSMENVSFADQHWAYMPRNQSVITLRESTNAGSGSNIADTNVASNSQFMCQGSYISG